jgi:serine/threonine-protein kinase
LLGFLVALLLAWAYEITPAGIVTSAEAQASGAATQASGQRLNYVIMGLVIVAVVFLLVDRYALDLRPAPQADPRQANSGAAPVIAAAVMLPAVAPLAVASADIGFDSPSVAISPDSRWLAYVSMDADGSHLVRHRLDGFDQPETIAGTEGAIHPFFSPDGKYIGFLTNERLKRVPVEGDDVKTIASSRSPVRAQWFADNSIYFIDDQGNSLRRVDVRSGNVETLRENDPLIFSAVLPGAQFALGTQRDASISGDYAEMLRVDIETGEFELLGIAGFDARWVPTGHLVFGRNGNLFAVPFDAQTAETSGEPQLVLKNVAMDSTFHQGQVALSTAGTLAYIPGNDRAIGQVVVVDRDGQERKLPPSPQRFGVLDLSADDSEMALQVADVKDYVWVYDLANDKGRKLAGSVGFGWPKYAPDGSLALSESTTATIDTRIKIVPADGSAPRLVMDSTDVEAVVSDWSPDGTLLSLSNWATTSVGLIGLSGQDELQEFDADVQEWGAVFSPDGQWLAYSSVETGRFEIWVRSLSEPGQRRQVTVNGGIEGIWCPCGEIFFRRGDEFWSIAVETEPELVFGAEVLAFTVADFLDTPGRSYDVSSDGQRLYTLKRSEPAIVDRVHVISNWQDKL